MTHTREALLMKLGAAKSKTPTAWRLIKLDLDPVGARFTDQLDRDKLRLTRRREGRYLLRTNLTETDPAKLRQFYLKLVEVEAAFKTLKADLAIRPVFHQSEQRIEALRRFGAQWKCHVARGRFAVPVGQAFVSPRCSGQSAGARNVSLSR